MRTGPLLAARVAGFSMALVLVLALATAAWTDGLEGLAAPGPCAEEDDTLRGDPEQGVGPEVFDLAGGPRQHFDPRDVAAGPGGPGFVPPDAPKVPRGPCEGPAAGCADVFAPRTGGIVITEPKPGTGGGPVFGGGTP